MARTAAHKARRRELYQERIAAGVCGMCGAEATEGLLGGRTKCDRCRGAHAKVQQKRLPVLVAAKKDWARDNPTETRQYDNEVRRFTQYGITREQYYEMLARQDGRCGICRKPFSSQGPAIDHCHTTGKVRGLLCAACNKALGGFRDDAVALRAAAEYVEGGGINGIGL